MGSKKTTQAVDALASTYQPIVRGYFMIAAVYYAIMTLTHFWYVEAESLQLMAGVSSLATVVIGASWYRLRKPQKMLTLELITTLVNMLMLTNVLVALHIEYAQVKLVYFIMMVMIFGLTSLSLRQASLSTILVIGALAFEVRLHDALQVIYGFVGFGAAFSALSISHYLRGAFGLAIEAKNKADVARATAEKQLAGEKSLGETLKYESITDSLTKLPNRRAFFDELAKRQNSEPDGKRYWLALLDLDGFKAVNDSHGHLMGDELLKAAAFRMRYYCGDDAHVSRIGGDEFAVLFETANAAGNGSLARLGAPNSEAEKWCQGLLDRLARTFPIAGRLVQISGSIGCCEIDPSKEATKLFHEADFALLQAKKNGKSQVMPFTEHHAKEAEKRQGIEQALKAADFDQEIELVFQPQFALDTTTMVRAEALARWTSPKVGKIGPTDFVKIAEECGLIADISIAVVRKALDTLSGWDDPIPLSINLSANDLTSDQAIDDIIALLAESSVAHDLIEFEVTETAMLHDTSRATKNLGRLAALGHKIAIDDFGTGYSNFSYLRSLPIHKLKIDRSFLENLSDPMTEKVLKSLVGMASTLGVECLLEGVEDELGLMVAKRAGAGFVQGYLLGRPMSAKELVKAQPEAREAADELTQKAAVNG